jgi:two-component system, OmpR family, response regulator VanR
VGGVSPVPMTDPAKPTVLVVDDDQDTRDAIAEMLEDHGFRVVRKGNGRQAEHYLSTSVPPTLMILDLMMPDLDGWALAAFMRQGRLPKVPLIVVTAAGDHWGYPAPPDHVLKKPLDPHRLVALVQQIARPS